MVLLFVEILFEVFLNGTRSESIVAFEIRWARKIIIELFRSLQEYYNLLYLLTKYCIRYSRDSLLFYKIFKSL